MDRESGPGAPLCELCEYCEQVPEKPVVAGRLLWLPRGRSPCLRSPGLSDPSEGRQGLERRVAYRSNRGTTGMLLLPMAAEQQYNDFSHSPPWKPDLLIEGPGKVQGLFIYKPSQRDSFPRVANHPFPSVIGMRSGSPPPGTPINSARIHHFAPPGPPIQDHSIGWIIEASFENQRWSCPWGMIRLPAGSSEPFLGCSLTWGMCPQDPQKSGPVGIMRRQRMVQGSDSGLAGLMASLPPGKPCRLLASSSTRRPRADHPSGHRDRRHIAGCWRGPRASAGPRPTR
jgi:hypothetical protein